MNINIIDINYWLNLSLFIPTLAFQVGILKSCFNKDTPLRIIWFLSAILGIVAIGCFLITQIHWLLTGSDKLINSRVAIVWIVFDYNNAAFYLASSAAAFFTLRLYHIRTRLMCSISHRCPSKK